MSDYIELAPHLEPEIYREDSLRGFKKVQQTELLEKVTRNDKVVGTMTPVLGARGETFKNFDQGFFATVKTAYNNHYILKTGPEDWWYTIAQKVALAIDNNTKKQEVRDFFVSHEGKKSLVVCIGTTIYGADWSWFFDQMAEQIEENINNPEYVGIMDVDFSESSKVQRIVGRIVLMTSMQEFFTYVCKTKCGIPGVIMKGNVEDWKNLSVKLKKLEAFLKPIEHHLELGNWWGECAEVCSKLADTKQGNVDKDWWSKIMSRRSFGSGPQYMKGWFVQEFLGLKQVEESNIQSGLVKVPMVISDGENTNPSILVAGIAGCNVNFEEVAREQSEKNPTEDSEKFSPFYPSVESCHTWALMMEPDSVFRNDLEKVQANSEDGG